MPTSTDAANIAVWVYDAEHDSFGGGGAIRPEDTRGADVLSVEAQRARGEFVVSTWTDAFARRFLFGDTSVEPTLYGDVTIEGTPGEWWDYHPASSGEPLIFVSSRPHQSNAPGEFGVRVVLDTMVRGPDLTCGETVINDGLGSSSEGLPFRSENWPAGTLRSDCAINLAEYPDATNGRYETFVVRADYTALPDEPSDPIERSIAWDVSELDLANAEFFSVRVSNIDEVNDLPGMGCAPLDGDATDEAGFRIVFVSAGGAEVSVVASSYARLLAPDIFETFVPLSTLGFCPVSHFLQTVRVPLGDVVCDAFLPGDIVEVRLEFDRDAAPEGRAVLLDTVEFQRELSGQSVCP